jgi:hypothetical protein
MSDSTLQQDEHIKQAKMVFIQFEKVLSRRKLFSKEHKSYHDAGIDLYKIFKRYTDKYDELACIVGEYDFYIEKESVYKNKDPYESVPFKLYRDGIRKIVFSNTLTEKEFTTFLDIIGETYETSDIAEESLQTELWKQDFDSISYFAIEGISDNEKVSESFEYELDAYFEEFTKYINKSSVDQVKVKDVKSLIVDRESFLPKELLKESPMEMTEDAQLATVSTLEEVEVTKIMTHVQQLDEWVILRKFVLILFNILEHPRLSDEKKIVVELFQKIAAFYLQQGDIEKLLDIIESLRKSIVNNKHFNKENYKEFIESIDFEKSIESIKKQDTAYWQSRQKVLYNFLSLFPKEKTNRIYEELFGIEQLQGCDDVLYTIMRERGTESLPFLVEVFLDNTNKKASKKAFDILKEINSPELVELLMPSLEHPSDIVRMSIFTLLDNVADFEATEVWETFLKDSKYRIRKLALKKIIRLQGKKSFPIVIKLLQEDSLESRSMDEQKELFRIAARLCEELLLPHLEKIMSGKSLFISERKINQKLCALEALSLMKSPNAERLLKKAARSWNPQLRKNAKIVYDKFNEENSVRRKKVS